MDTCALGLKKAAAIIANDFIADTKAKRYAGWDDAMGKQILGGEYSLASLADLATRSNLDPKQVSGKQELLENQVNQVLFGR